jgi:hypothetical protein
MNTSTSSSTSGATSGAMSSGTIIGLFGVGSMVLLLVGALIWAVDFDRAGVVGCSVGAALGLLNLVAGLRITASAMRKGGSKAVMSVITFGFLARFFALAILIVVFHFVAAVNTVAFALTFLLLFMVFLGLEVRLVASSLRRPA